MNVRTIGSLIFVIAIANDQVNGQCATIVTESDSLDVAEPDSGAKTPISIIVGEIPTIVYVVAPTGTRTVQRRWPKD